MYDAIEAKYQRSFGVLAGYLPRDRSALDRWHKKLAEKTPKAVPPQCTDAVQKLVDLLNCDPIIRMYVTEMVEQAQCLPDQKERRDTVKSVDQLLAALDKIVQEAPTYGTKEDPGIPFPMSALFAYMMMTQAGEAVFRNKEFNEVLRNILKEWCGFLNDEKSGYVLVTDPGGWLSKDADEKLQLSEDYVTDEQKKADPEHWGFRSWNEFFHRQFKNIDEKRPLSRDPRAIVSANDGHVYHFASNVQKQDNFWAKGQAFSLEDMLKGQHEYLGRFIGGDVIQSFLSGNDYHRFVAPIAGTVKKTEIIPGLMFSDAESAGFDPEAGVLSQGYEVAVNTRGLVFIESQQPKIGMVCVIPIGITEVSSITIEVTPDQKVDKGAELGYFSFGGSTLCMVFQPDVIDYYTLRAPNVKDPNLGPQGSINSIIRAREQIAIVKTS